MRLQFDRGTLVLQGHPADRELAKLPGVRWDPRVQRQRAPAYRYRAIVAGLRRAEIQFEDGVRIPRPQAWPWSEIDLRPYQHAALLAWGRNKQGMVVLPTGSGKTRLACAAMAGCGACSLCLVPTRALLHQWRDEIRRHYAGAVGCLGDGERRIEDVTVATFEGAYRHMGRLGNRFGLLIVDEAHHFGTGMRDEALEMCAAPRRLALTATAPEGPALARILELMGPVVCELSIADLAGQWLAEFDTVVLRLRLTPDAHARYEAATSVFRDVFDQFRRFSKHARWSDFVAMAARSAGGQAALEAFRYSRRLTSYPEAKRAALAELLARHRGSRMLVFTSDNETAYTIAREHLVMPMTCDIARAEREQALSAFRSGELEVLVSAQVLNEGIDVPDADIAIIVGGLRGGREHVQRVGRLLRPLPGKRALVYELVMMGTHEVRKARERRRALLPAAVARDAG
jgi:superfamily II DNA or RNA helicase